MLGDRFVLLGCGVDPAAHLGEADAARAGRLPAARSLRIEPRGSESRGAPRYEDLSDALVPGARSSVGCWCVRPDKTVMHEGPADECERLVRESLALLGVPDPPTADCQQPSPAA